MIIFMEQSQRKFDLHIHTEATAPYLQGDSQLEQYHQRGEAARLQFMGISDHYHYFWQKTRYVHQQRAHLNTHNYTNPMMFLGVEQTILSDSGRIGIRSDGIAVLDYILLAVHWMSYGGRLNKRDLVKIWLDTRKRQKLCTFAFNYYINAVKNSKIARLPKILAHPLSFGINHITYYPEITETYLKLIDFCGKEHIALELNTDLLPRPDNMKNPHEIPDDQRAFFTTIFKAFNENRVQISLGSDAHRLENIGKVDALLDLAHAYRLNMDLLLKPEIFISH
jgi:histidinol phosphatase-like PHP family hydrolase